ncbi:MAG: Gfo/Idh/MocA family oxidoreductase [Lentisphaeria bacterium]|nr:Gfo/Idh/MocA family oxidoreductase [Lentisphaeria bacterium]
MLKVCINYETGGGRKGGHFTHFAFTGLPGVEIAALADSNPQAEKTFHLTGAKRLYPSFPDMMEHEKPDIVILCSRLPGEHVEQIRYTLNHRCHVLCEKPFAETLDQADELVELSNKTGYLVQMAHLARFAPTFREMKRMIQAGEIGKVLTCHLRGKEDTRGGGEDMIVLGTHVMDAAYWIFGQPEQVFSDIRCHGHPLTVNDILTPTEPIGPCGGDEIYSLYRFPNGVNGVFESRHVVNSGDVRLGMTVCGTKGILAIRYTGNRELRICRDFPVPEEDHAEFQIITPPENAPIPDAEPIDYEAWQINPNVYFHRYFVENNRRAAWNLLQAIQGKEPLVAGIDSAVGSLEMITGAYQSALNRAVVDFPLADRHHPLERKYKES